MKWMPAIPRKLEATAVTVAILLATGLLFLMANDAAPRGHQCAGGAYFLGCMFNEHPEFSAGIITAAGAIFAAWLAWRGARDQVDDARGRAAEERRDRLRGEYDRSVRDLDRLSTAGAFLARYVGDFPIDTDDSSEKSNEDFTETFLKKRYAAMDVASVTALGAPGGLGERIDTVMRRVATIGERIDSDVIQRSFSPVTIRTRYGPAIRELVAGMRTLSDQAKRDHETGLSELKWPP